MINVIHFKNLHKIHNYSHLPHSIKNIHSVQIKKINYICQFSTLSNSKKSNPKIANWKNNEFTNNSLNYLLNHYYNGSLIKLLQDTYPNYEWLPWKFESKVNQGFWKDI